MDGPDAMGQPVVPSRGHLVFQDGERRADSAAAKAFLNAIKIDCLEKAKKKSVGSKLIKSVSPGQLVVKIVNDTLIEILGHKEDPINLKATPPVIILMVGLQGSGKTTTSAKIAKR